MADVFEVPRKAKLDAVAALRDYDHAFLNEKGVAMFAKKFGVKLTPTKHKADAGPKNPKGLTLDNGAKFAIGMDAAVMAQIICRQLGVPYEEKMGRGSQLYACCNALEEHFKK